MSRTAKPTPLRAQAYQIDRPPLHADQAAVADDPARFKVVVCGRQWGKTTVGAVMAIMEATRGGEVCWVAPAYHQGELGWKDVEHMAREIPGTRVLGRPTYRITLASGGTLHLRSADDPNSLRGLTLNGVVFDEAAQAKPEAWPTLEPTLAIRGGWALFISTPRGMNWFHDLYQDAGHLPDWARWRFPSASSPYMNPEAIETARARHSPMWFAQEYEAEFISSGTQIFQPEWVQHYYEQREGEDRFFVLGEQTIPESACRIFHTVDLAQTVSEDADYTVISTWAATPRKHLLLLDWVRGRFEGPDVIPQMRMVLARYGGRMVVEKAMRQIPILQEAARQGLTLKEVSAGRQSRVTGLDAKMGRALPAADRMAAGMVWFPPASKSGWRDLEEELLSFPLGKHDDFVDTFAYAVAELGVGSAYEDHGVTFL